MSYLSRINFKHWYVNLLALVFYSSLADVVKTFIKSDEKVNIPTELLSHLVTLAVIGGILLLTLLILHRFFPKLLNIDTSVDVLQERLHQSFLFCVILVSTINVLELLYLSFDILLILPTAILLGACAVGKIFNFAALFLRLIGYLNSRAPKRLED